MGLGGEITSLKQHPVDGDKGIIYDFPGRLLFLLSGAELPAAACSRSWLGERSVSAKEICRCLKDLWL